MQEHTHLIPAHSRVWDEWMRRVAHDVFHTRTYHAFSQACGEGEGYLAVHGTRSRFIAWPYLLRPIDDTLAMRKLNWYDITSVYGYSGPVVYGCELGDPFVGHALRALEEAWRTQRVITVFCRFHPVLKNYLRIEGAIGEGPIQGAQLLGHTVSIDLTNSYNTIWTNSYRRSLLQQLTQIKRLGMSIQIDSEWAHLPEFLDIYHETMLRNVAPSYYFFSETYLRGLKAATQGHSFLVSAHCGSEVVSACIVLEYGGILNMHLAGTKTNWLHCSPYKLIIDQLIDWGQARGNRLFHLGGGRGATQDSLFLFKSAFSPDRHRFHVGRYILDTEKYDSLCRSHRHAADEAGLTYADSSYFPLYRTPLTAEGETDQAFGARKVETRA